MVCRPFLNEFPTPAHLAASGFLNLMPPWSIPCLPALFHAGSALGVPPPGFCSPYAAVRCFQRRFPLDVGPPGSSAAQNALVSTEVKTGCTLALVHQDRNIPRLQGFALHKNPPPGLGGLDPTKARNPLGIFPSREFSLVEMAQISPSLPSCGCSPHARRHDSYSTSGYHSQQDRLVSKRPPPLLGLIAFWQFTTVRDGRSPGVTSARSEKHSGFPAIDFWTV